MPGTRLDAQAVRLLLAPYDSGRVDARMGRGPTALAGAGAAERLRRRGHVVTEQVLVPSDPAHDVEGRMRETALALLEAVAGSATPLRTVVSGGRA